MKDVSEAYQCLGIPTTSSEEAIKERYHYLAKQYHPDVQDGDAEENNEILAEITKAYNLIINYLNAGRNTSFKPVEKDPKQIKAAEVSFKRGRSYLEKGDINSALSTFETIYRQFPENTKYLFFCIKAMMEKPRRLHDAKDLCQELIHMEPFEPNSVKLMGDIYLKAGIKDTAKKYYEKAVELGYDPEIMKTFQRPAEKGLFKKIIRSIMTD